MSLRSCKNIIGVLIILSFFKCTNHSTPPASEVSTDAGNTTHPTAAGKSLADTVTLHISNGSLSPDYQFVKEWVLTEKEAVYRETVGEEPERVSRKKMEPQFWEQLRNFDPNAPFDKIENQIDGADEKWLIFHSGGKQHRFPAEVFDSKVSAIERFSDPEP